MTTGEFLQHATRQLQAAGIGTARLDVLVLLEDTLNTNRVHILANPDLLISKRQLEKLQKLLARRAQHEPLAYIRNKTEFYARNFFVDARVLEPRAESETMIDLLKRTSPRNQSNPSIIDIGTGSGALAITAKLEIPSADVYAVDIDKKCLAVARKNAEQLSAQITFAKSDLLTKIPKEAVDRSALLCNLPYVPDNFQINRAASHEPDIAIFGGGDGLDLYRKLFAQLHTRNLVPRYVLTEALPPQHKVLARVAERSGFVLDQAEDFIQVFKIASARLGS